MALKIRLSRGGRKKRPFYSIVVADSRKPRDGRFIEKIGTYNPLLPKEEGNRVTLDGERATYWLGQGAKPSDRVAIFLGKAGLADMPAQRNNPQKAKPKAAAVQREDDRKAKAEARAEAAKEAATAPAPEETPAEPAEETQTEEATTEATTEAPAATDAPVEEAAETPAETPAETAEEEKPAA